MERKLKKIVIVVEINLKYNNECKNKYNLFILLIHKTK
jgi:hypothetical protein